MIIKQTSLDLNGPILSFIQQPQSISVSCEDVLLGSVATFIGVATATFPQQSPENPATNTGTIAYRWYDDNGALFDDPPPEGGDGATITGSATTTLRLYGNKVSRKIFLRAQYIQSAYSQPSESSVEVGTARSTGNAVNEPIDSNIVDLDLKPTIILVSESLDQTTPVSTNAVFSIFAFSSDASNLSYQWQFNNSNISDGTTQSTTNTAVGTTLTITDNLGQTATVNFSNLLTYSDFIPGRTYTLVANGDIQTRITASGAGGGASITRNVPGGAGGTSSGTFTFIAGQQYKLIVGGKGGDGGAAGFGGGGSGGGGTGIGGGGGGYTGLFINSVEQSNAIIIAGGGGGGNDDPAAGGSGGGTSGGNSSNAGRGGFGGTQSSGGAPGGADGSSGAPGSALQGGSGGAGGGGGYYGGGGGQYYNGCCAGGGGGGGSGYIHPTLLSGAPSTNLGGGSSADGTFSINLLSATKTINITATGTRTPNLTIRSDTIGLNQVKCIISHPTACNSPIITRAANFAVANPRNILIFEGYTSQNTFERREVNLDQVSNFTLTDTTFGPGTNIITFYASEKSIDIEMDIRSAKGADGLNGSTGGNGGASRIRKQIETNQEYAVLGVPSNSGVFLYRGSRLISVVGKGGDAGSSGNGGAGGGVNNAGSNGSGTGAGTGGSFISAGQLTTAGIFGSNSSVLAQDILSGDSKANIPNGGRSISCSKGSYWTQQGVSACSDNGTTQFRNTDGTLIPRSAFITRGFKPGYTITSTEGRLTATGGNGGNGATGGSGGSSGGGGGGSGYTDGSVTVLSSTSGGNGTLKSTINFKIYVPPPPPPPPPAPPPPPPPPPPVCNDRYYDYRYGGAGNTNPCPTGQARRGQWYEANDGNWYPRVNSTGGLIQTIQFLFLNTLNRPCGVFEIENAINIYNSSGPSGLSSTLLRAESLRAVTPKTRCGFSFIGTNTVAVLVYCSFTTGTTLLGPFTGLAIRG